MHVMDSASAIGRPVREPETQGDGGLTPLARKALEPRLERVQAAVRVRELLLDPASLGVAPSADARELRGGTAQPAMQPLPGQLASLLPFAPASTREPPDGRALREVQSELRALRAEIAQLARALGFPVRESNRLEYRGILQQQGADEHTAKAAHPWEQEDGPEARLRALIKRNEALRIVDKQLTLLKALDKAQQRLAEAPKQLPPGLRDSVIGEIYRAKYNTALFGGAGGAPGVSGALMDAAV